MRVELCADLEEVLRAGGHKIVRVERACFDIFVRTRDGRAYIVKVLINADGLRREVAEELRRISHFLEAVPVVVALKRHTGPLKKGVVYHRYEVPVIDPLTFVRLVEGELPKAVADRGGQYVAVRADEVGDLDVSGVRRRQLRREGGRITLARAEEADVEGVPVELKIPEHVDTGRDRMTRFERRVAEILERMGAERTGKVRRAPFKLLAKDGEIVLARAEEGGDRESIALRDVASATGSMGVIVTRERCKDTYVPTIDIGTLEEIKDLEDLKEYLQERDPEERVRQLVEEAGITSPKEIAQRTGIRESVIREFLRRMGIVDGEKI
ncbi:hypothetical protein [Methanopyrus sp.]